MKDLSGFLRQQQRDLLYRTRLTSEGPQQPQMCVNNHRVVAFCSNDYLGLANHPKLIRALQQGAERYGVGAGASHLINGHSQAHHALEEELAEFTGRERALLFSTGYMANLGVTTALLTRGDAVFEDRLNHASLLDAGLLCGAHFTRYAHADVPALEHKLAVCTKAQKLLLTDGVFSMDGDLAPLPELTQLARRYDAWLMVDDAHGLGVLNDGRGSVAHYALNMQDVPILMGTLGKAFGTFGAFVAGSEALIETLIQRARTYIYTTALPPALAQATRVSLQLVQDESWRRDKLNALITRFRHGAQQLGLRLTNSQTAIQPLIVGDVRACVRMSQALYEQGIWVTAIRPPTVPAGSARLRITFSAAHSEQQVDQLLNALDSCYLTQAAQQV